MYSKMFPISCVCIYIGCFDQRATIHVGAYVLSVMYRGLRWPVSLNWPACAGICGGRGDIDFSWPRIGRKKTTFILLSAWSFGARTKKKKLKLISCPSGGATVHCDISHSSQKLDYAPAGNQQHKMAPVFPPERGINA